MKEFHFQNQSQIEATDKKIRNLEKFIDAKLPDDFIQFLKEYKGGWLPTRRDFVVFWGKNNDLPWPKQEGNTNSLYSIEELQESFKDNLKDPEYFFLPIKDLEIGYSESGRVFIKLHEPHRGKVFFWPYELIAAYDDILDYRPKFDFANHNLYLPELASVVADTFEIFSYALLNKYEDYSLTAGKDYLVSLLDGSKEDIQFWKKKGEHGEMLRQMLEYSFYNVMLNHFSRAKTAYKAFCKAKDKYEDESLDCILQWEGWKAHIQLAEQEHQNGLPDWRFRFARRVSSIDPDQEPLPIPEGFEYSEVITLS